MEPALDPVALSRLKWRCRRGLLENDLFIERFFERHGSRLTQRQADGLQALMDLADNDLLDLLLRAPRARRRAGSRPRCTRCWRRCGWPRARQRRVRTRNKEPP